MSSYQLTGPRTRGPRLRRSLFGFAIVVGLILLGAPIVASYVIEYQWWREMKQVPTWIDMMLYTLSPVAVATLLTFGVLFAAHARGMKFAGIRLREHSRYAKLSAAVLLLIAIVLAAGAIDTWTVVRYFGGWNLPVEATAWRDSVFGLPLGFYLFDLPFYALLRGFVLVLAVAAGVVYWLTARGWQLRDRIAELQKEGQLNISILGLRGALESRFLRGVAAVFLLAFALRYFLGRYEMVWNDHGFMVGVDYVDQQFALPLQWLVIAACLAAAVFVSVGRWKLAAWMALALVIRVAGPPAVRAVYVRPNEISLERPYIQKHIEATRSAFGLDRRVTETEVAAKLDGRFDPAKNQALLQNVRLWDWRAFRDTVTQIQALRPYYSFADTDVDRYMIDGQLRQVLLTPRELDIRQLPDATDPLDQSPFHLHPRLRSGDGGGESDHRGRPAPSFYPGCSRGRQDEQPEADTSRALLRGSYSRAGLRAHSSSPSSTTRRARTTCLLATRVRAGFRFPPCPCASPRRSRKQIPTSC